MLILRRYFGTGSRRSARCRPPTNSAAPLPYLVDHSETRNGFLVSRQWASQGLTALLASIFGVVLTGVLTDRQLLSWGWRLPFFFGLLLGPVGIYIRRRMAETLD